MLLWRFPVKPGITMQDFTLPRCSRGIDAYGVSGFGSAMPESMLSVAAFALHATLAASSVKSLQWRNGIPEEI